MDAIESGFRRFLEVTLEWLPKLLGAVIILIIGMMIANAIRGLIRKLLTSAKLNQRLYQGSGGGMIRKAIPDPSDLVASIAYWAVMFGTISIAVSVLGIDALTDFVAAIYSYLPNVLAALLIFLVAGAISGAVAGLASRTLGDTALGKLAATVVPVVVMGIATFMILEQLMIAPAIITITYACLMGSAALGLALAFGLGGRDVASRLLESTYQKGVENAGKFKSEAKVAKARAKSQAQNAADSMR